MSSASLPDDADALLDDALGVLRMAGDRGWKIASAESCTGGLLSSLLTDLEGFSGSFECGFTTYSDEAKADLLGVEPILIARHGAVAMVKGALARSRADIAIAITGFAGPGGKQDEEGLVFLAAASKAGPQIVRECHFGPRGRESVRQLAARSALEMLREVMDARSAGNWRTGCPPDTHPAAFGLPPHVGRKAKVSSIIIVDRSRLFACIRSQPPYL